MRDDFGDDFGVGAIFGVSAILVCARFLCASKFGGDFWCASKFGGDFWCAAIFGDLGSGIV